MIYVVWLNGDHEPYTWFMVFGKKSLAMDYAKRLLSETGEYKKVKYVSQNSGVSAVDLAYDGFLVVEQRDCLYHGA